MKFTLQLLRFLEGTALAFAIGFVGAYLLHRFDTVMILSAGMLFGAAIMFAWHHWSVRQHLRLQREKHGAAAIESAVREFKAGFVAGKMSHHKVIEPVSLQGGVWRN